MEQREQEATNYKNVVFVDAVTRGISEVAVFFSMLVMCSLYVLFGDKPELTVD